MTKMQASDLTLVKIIQSEKSSPRETQNAKRELCLRYVGLIKRYAHADHLKTVRDESEAHLWLCFLEALYNYDTASQIPITGYFKSCIKFGQWNFFKKQRRLWQREMYFSSLSSAQDGPSQDDDALLLSQLIDVGQLDNDVIDHLWQRELFQQLRNVVPSLSAREKELLLRHYYGGQSLAQIARHWGYSKQRLSYQHQKLLTKLRQLLLVPSRSPRSKC